jgi:uncharacterized membrane protein YdbT with pleckstrin-like domain
MAYIDKILLPDERVLCATSVHWMIYTEGFLITVAGGLLGHFGAPLLNFIMGESIAQHMTRAAGFVSCFIVFVGLALMLASYMRQTYTELAVTNRRVIAKYGIISRTTYEILVSRISGANFDQTVMGRLLGFGTVIIHGAGGDISPFDEIDNPQAFYKALMNVIEHNR